MDSTTIFLWITMMLITLSMGLGLTTADFRRVLTTPRPVGLGALLQLVALPLTGFAVAWAFGLPPALAVGTVLIAACPGGTHSNLFAGLARADVALSITLTAVSGIASIATIPLWLGLATRTFAGEGRAVTVDVGGTMLSLLVIVGLPTMLGVAVRSWSDRVAHAAARATLAAGVSLLLVIVVGAVAANGALVVEYGRTAGVPVVVLNLSTMCLGWWSGRRAGLPVAQRATLALEVGVQNSALGYGLATTLLGDIAFAVPGIVYSLWVYITGTALVVWMRRHSPDRGEQP